MYIPLSLSVRGSPRSAFFLDKKLALFTSPHVNRKVLRCFIINVPCVAHTISETSIISPQSTLVRNALLSACCDGATFNPAKVSLCSKRPAGGRDEYIRTVFAIYSFLRRESGEMRARADSSKCKAAERRVSFPDIKNVRESFVRQSPREELAKVAR